MTLARAKALLSWCLSVLPEDPPSPGLEGWTHAMREEWDAKRDAIGELLDELDEASAAHGGPADGWPGVPSTRKESLVSADFQPRADQPAVVVAAPAGSPERAAQIERVGLSLDPEKPRRLCAICLASDHQANTCPRDYAR